LQGTANCGSISKNAGSCDWGACPWGIESVKVICFYSFPGCAKEKESNENGIISPHPPLQGLSFLSGRSRQIPSEQPSIFNFHNHFAELLRRFNGQLIECSRDEVLEEITEFLTTG